MVPRSLAVDRLARKRLGAWYTPENLVRPMVEWAVRSLRDEVLDPACGGGSFLTEVVGRLRQLGSPLPTEQVHGVDVHDEALRLCSQALETHSGSGIGLHLRHGNFFDLPAPGGVVRPLEAMHVVVGNPPFIRYQLFTGRNRAAGLARARDQGLRLPSLCSSWAPFLVHAAAFVRTGGRLAFVLPTELLHASYASQVRDFLRRTFGSVSVIAFEDHVFPESQERVVLLLADDKGCQDPGELRLASVRSPADLVDLRNIIRRAERFGRGQHPAKWLPRDRDMGVDLVDRLIADELLVPLQEIGKASIGFVSGANDYFVLKPSEVEAARLPRRLLRPTVMGAKHVPGARLLPTDFRRMAEGDERCWLWDGSGSELPEVAAYIRLGKARGIHERYKCRVRTPWHVVPGVHRPDAFLTYMSDAFPRLVLNATRAACSNTLHAVTLKGVVPDLRSAFVATFFNSATLLSAERIGRPYGGGVLKLEPSEADRLHVPSPRAVARIRDGAELIAAIDSGLRKKDFEAVVSRADQAFLRDVCRLKADELSAIQEAVVRRRCVRLRSRKHGVTERR